MIFTLVTVHTNQAVDMALWNLTLKAQSMSEREEERIDDRTSVCLKVLNDTICFQVALSSVKCSHKKTEKREKRGWIRYILSIFRIIIADF